MYVTRGKNGPRAEDGAPHVHGRISGCSVSGEELGRRDGTEGYGSRVVRRCVLEVGAPGGRGGQSGRRRVVVSEGDVYLRLDNEVQAGRETDEVLGRNRNDSANLSVGTPPVTGTGTYERRPFLIGKGSAPVLGKWKDTLARKTIAKICKDLS